jgi:hypothetical protein
MGLSPNAIPYDSGLVIILGTLRMS